MNGGNKLRTMWIDGRELDVPEMKMCRWACGRTRDPVRNDNTRERLKVENITERCRKERLR